MKKLLFIATAFFMPIAMSANLSPNVEIDLQKKQNKIDAINNEIQKIRDAVVRDVAQQPAISKDTNAIKNEKKYLLTNIVINTVDQQFYTLDIRPFIQPYLGTKVGKQEIFSLIKDVNAYLASKGFVTSTVSLTPVDLHKGVLRLNILWGKVGGILINRKAMSSFSERAFVKQIVPASVGSILNLHDIDQAVENINNDANRTRVEILPSTHDGYSFLNIIMGEDKGPAFNFSVDNSGPGSSPKTGLYRYSAGVTFNNVIFGTDNLGLKVNTRHYDRDGGRHNYYGGLNYEVPLAYTRFAFQASTSNTGQNIHGAFDDYTSKSAGETYGLRVTQVLARNATDKWSTYADLQRKRTKNYVDGIMTSVNSKPYTDLSLGLQYTTSLLGDGIFSDLSYNRGLPQFGGDKAGFDHNSEPVNFDRFLFDLSWQPYFTLAGRDFYLSTHLNGQYSNEHLLDIYRMVVGDEYTVRGYKDDDFYGDKGVVLNNTLSMPLVPIYGVMLTPFIGIDGSYLQNINDENNYATGAAVGVKSNFGRIANSLTLGVPLAHTDLNKKMDDYTFYWNISLYL